MIYPANFEQKIGFDRLRAQVAALCSMEAARRRIMEEAFSSKREAIPRRHPKSQPISGRFMIDNDETSQE